MRRAYPDPTLPLTILAIVIFCLTTFIAYLSGDLTKLINFAKFIIPLGLLLFILKIFSDIIDNYSFKKKKKLLDEYIANFDSYIKTSYYDNKIVLLDRLTNTTFTYDEFIKLKQIANSIDYNYKLKRIKVDYPYREICRLNFEGKRSICVMIIEKNL